MVQERFVGQLARLMCSSFSPLLPPHPVEVVDLEVEGRQVLAVQLTGEVWMTHLAGHLGDH